MVTLGPNPIGWRCGDAVGLVSVTDSSVTSAERANTSTPLSIAILSPCAAHYLRDELYKIVLVCRGKPGATLTPKGPGAGPKGVETGSSGRHSARPRLGVGQFPYVAALADSTVRWRCGHFRRGLLACLPT